jgi:hypothetical protein
MRNFLPTCRPSVEPAQHFGEAIQWGALGNHSLIKAEQEKQNAG